MMAAARDADVEVQIKRLIVSMFADTNARWLFLWKAEDKKIKIP